jgi:hypothetical protein
MACWIFNSLYDLHNPNVPCSPWRRVPAAVNLSLPHITAIFTHKDKCIRLQVQSASPCVQTITSQLPAVPTINHPHTSLKLLTLLRQAYFLIFPSTKPAILFIRMLVMITFTIDEHFGLVNILHRGQRKVEQSAKCGKHTCCQPYYPWESTLYNLSKWKYQLHFQPGVHLKFKIHHAWSFYNLMGIAEY